MSDDEVLEYILEDFMEELYNNKGTGNISTYTMEGYFSYEGYDHVASATTYGEFCGEVTFQGSTYEFLIKDGNVNGTEVEFFDKIEEEEMTREHVPKNHGKPWARGDELLLLNKFNYDLSIASLAKLLERKQSGVLCKLHQLEAIKLQGFECLDKNSILDFNSACWGNKTREDLMSYEVEKPVEGFSLKKPTSISNKSIDRPETQCNNTNSTNKEENKMRRVVAVNVFDDDKGLPAELSLVASFKDITTEDDNESVIREVLMEGQSYEPDGLTMAELLDTHNICRNNTTDEAILHRTGNEVMLRDIKLKDLRFEVV